MSNILIKGYKLAQHPAHITERPLHAIYFAFVAWHGQNMMYTCIALFCCATMIFTLKDFPDA